MPVHLDRRPDEPADLSLLRFYENLLACINLPVTRNGTWSLLQARPAWEGNWTVDCFVCFWWNSPTQEPLMVAINYASNQSQCYIPVPSDALPDGPVHLEDLAGDHIYMRDGGELRDHGLYVDLPAWGYHVFRLGLKR